MVGRIGRRVLATATTPSQGCQVAAWPGKRRGPNTTFGDRFETDMSGFAVAMNARGEPMVAFVLPGTPAADAGLERGDVIVSVDGSTADRRTLGELRERCRRPW